MQQPNVDELVDIFLSIIRSCLLLSFLLPPLPQNLSLSTQQTLINMYNKSSFTQPLTHSPSTKDQPSHIIIIIYILIIIIYILTIIRNILIIIYILFSNTCFIKFTKSNLTINKHNRYTSHFKKLKINTTTTRMTKHKISDNKKQKVVTLHTPKQTIEYFCSILNPINLYKKILID